LKSQILKTKCNTTEKIFISFLGISILSLYVKVLLYSNFSILNIGVFLIGTIIFSSLVFLAYIDLKIMEVHNLTSLILFFFLSVLNIVLFLIKRDITLANGWQYIAYDNIFAALILGSISQLIVLISKEKALGQGDVRMLLIAGLLVGKTNLMIWGYLTVFSALAYGVVIGLRKKKFKNVKIPLLPFIVLSIIITLLFL
jgi:leader peptidase (prepilin peptidase)/N-methyltransferase